VVPASVKNAPGPGQYLNLSELHPHKEKSPAFSFGRRDGISAETLAKSRLGRIDCKSFGPKRCDCFGILLQCS
jgi:hypothetical protein